MTSRVATLGLVLALSACHDWDRFSRVYGDAAPDDSATDAGGCATGEESVCPGDALFCEGFEDELSGVWTTDTTGAAVIGVEQTCARRGEGALHATTAEVAAGSSGRSIIRQTAAATPDPTLSARVFLWVDQELEGDFALLSFVAPDDAAQMQLRVKNGAFLVKETSSNEAQTSTHVVEANRWMCLELEVTVGVGARAWIDDQDPPTELAVPPVGDIEQMNVGFQWANPLEDVASQSAWFDELVVAIDHIGCEP